MLTICALIFAGLAGLASAQETVYGPYVEVSTSFGDRSPCKGEFVKFDASKSEDRHYNGSVSFAWSVNGQPDPQQVGNSSIYSFTIGGVGPFNVTVLVKNTRGAGTQKHIAFSSIECQAPPTASSATQGPGPVYAHIWVQKVCLEGAPMSGEHSQGADGASIVSWVWSIQSPSGKTTSLEGRMVTFVGSEEGYHAIVLYVKDANGNTGQTSRSDYSFYRCNYQDTSSPTPTTVCKSYTYYDNRTQENKTEQRCETYSPTPSPAPTAQAGYDYERCAQLQHDYDTYKADYNYRYEKYRSTGDQQALAELEAEKDRYVTYWQEQWRSAGCDYASGGDSECGRVFMELQASIDEFKSRMQGIWDVHYQSLADARQQFGAAGHHNETEWTDFEVKWKRLAFEIESRVKAEIEAFLSRHPALARCGFQYYGGEAGGTDYQKQYAAAPTPAADAYSLARAACEEKMLRLKDEYASQFEDLYRRLGGLPEGFEYDTVKRQISLLESAVQSRVQSLIEDCRAQYADHYDAPQNYKDGAGNLYCYFDETAKGIACRGQYVSFEGDPETQVLSRFGCGGQLFFDQMYSNDAFEDFAFDETGDGGALAIRSSSLKVIIHDSPRGVINVGLLSGTEMYFVPAIQFEVTVEGNKVVLDGGGSNGLWMGGQDAFSWDPAKRVLTVKGEATWVSESCLPDGSKPDGSTDDKYWDAIRARKLGAQVVISLDDGDNEVDQDNETYDGEMEVKIKRERANRYEAIIDSTAGECKTVVLKFDASIFSTVSLKVTMQDEQGREIPVAEADNLEDVLDPCDDGGNVFEYWIVVDKYGTQVLVSFAHFSEKHVSVEAAAVSNIGVPGFEAASLSVAALVALAALVVSRRRLTR